MSGRARAPWAVRLSVQVYRRALLLYPEPFRREFGDELAEVFRELATGAWRRRGMVGVLLLWPTTIFDLVRGSIAERRRALRERRSSDPALTSSEVARAKRRRAAARLRSDSSPERLLSMERLRLDLRFAVRSLRRAPVFTLAVITTIALGVGASSTIFTVVDGIVLRPLPFPDSERAVVLCEVHSTVEGYCIASPPNVEDWGRMSESLETVGVARTYTYSLRGPDGATSISAGIATPGFLRIHGVRAVRGRLLQDGDMPPGSNRVVVVTHELWRTRFGADPEIVGRSVVMNEEAYTVIGVLEEDPWISEYGWVQAWVPLTATPEETDTRTWRGFSAVGLLEEGVSLGRLREEMEGIRAALEQEHPDANRGWGVRVESMRDRVAGPMRPTLMIFAAAVAAVLLIGCANVANLLLVRATRRRSEFALRASLGAGRRRLARQVLTESVLLAGLGGAAGLGLAMLATDGFLTLAPGNIPRLDEVAVDLRVAVFTALLSLITALLFGIVPAMRAARTDLADSLRNVRHDDGGGGGLRAGLVVGQVAMTLVLLVVAALLGRSLMALVSWDPGFDRDGLVTVWSSANVGLFETGAEINAAFERVADEMRAVPGVLAVGMSSAGPLFGGRETTTAQIEGQPPVPPEEQASIRWYDIGPDYFATMGIPLVRGRSFTAEDDVGSVPVAIVNEAFAARYFGSEDAVGERVRVEGDRTLQIVGVVADVTPFRPDQPPMPEIYYPKRQFPRGGTYYILRTAGSAGAVERAIRERVEAAQPAIDLYAFQTLQERTDRQLVSPRFKLALMALFALVALALSAVGIYGVIAYSVASRTHEIGVRIALGARPGKITLSVVGSALALAGIGLAIGVGIALAAGNLFASQLHGVSARDLPTYAIVASTALAVAALASLVPARRAARLDPVTALRTD